METGVILGGSNFEAANGRNDYLPSWRFMKETHSRDLRTDPAEHQPHLAYRRRGVDPIPTSRCYPAYVIGFLRPAFMSVRSY